MLLRVSIYCHCHIHIIHGYSQVIYIKFGAVVRIATSYMISYAIQRNLLTVGHCEVIILSILPILGGRILIKVER